MDSCGTRRPSRWAVSEGHSRGPLSPGTRARVSSGRPARAPATLRPHGAADGRQEPLRRPAEPDPPPRWASAGADCPGAPGTLRRRRRARRARPPWPPRRGPRGRGARKLSWCPRARNGRRRRGASPRRAGRGPAPGPSAPALRSVPSRSRTGSPVILLLSVDSLQLETITLTLAFEGWGSMAAPSPFSWATRAG